MALTHFRAHVVQRAYSALAALQSGIDGQAKVPQLEAPARNHMRSSSNSNTVKRPGLVLEYNGIQLAAAAACNSELSWCSQLCVCSAILQRSARAGSCLGIKRVRHSPLLCEEDVFRLDVPVVDAAAVQVLQGQHQRQDDLSSHILLLQAATAADQLLKQVTLRPTTTKK